MCFGSNLAGIHGAGAARYAYQKLDARWGKGFGYGTRQESFAIPTKDMQIQTLHLKDIEQHIQTFILIAKDHKLVEFQVTCIGCGLAGYKHSQIASLFEASPKNCFFDKQWSSYLPNHRSWGTYP